MNARAGCLLLLSSILVVTAASKLEAKVRVQGTPPGVVVAYAGDLATIPTGWLLCDGAEVSRTAFAALFAAIGEAHGAGNGTTTFRLPDYQGYFLRGVDGGTGNDPDAATRTPLGPGAGAGSGVGSLQNDATRRPNTAFAIATAGSHTHGHKDRDLRATNCAGCTKVDDYDKGSEDDYIYRFERSVTTDPSGDHQHAITGGDRETRPKNKYVHWIIKT